MYNGHIHIFNSKCAPDDFLKVGIPGEKFDGLADNIKSALETRLGRFVLRRLAGKGDKAGKISRLLTFFDIGVEASQRKVFERIHATYSGYNPRYFVLTLNMDYMSDEPSMHANFETQLKEVFQLKQTYPNELQVFLCCDPRYKKGKELRDWFRSYYMDGKVVGIKLYPALGYFPFDPAFDELFQFASENAVPVLTHTTRTGVFYIGKNVREYVGVKPASFWPDHPIMPSIYKRIENYRASTHKKIIMNDKYCNLYTHPENYIPMIEKFPGLKLCFAHYGGTKEILRQTDSYMLQVENDTTINWNDLIRTYIRSYPNVYTDISYSLADKDTYRVFKADMQDQVLKQKIIFGTDYFMEEQEKSEKLVFAEFREAFLSDPEAYRLLTESNPHHYLYGKVVPYSNVIA